MMLIFADRGIQSGWSADSIQSTLEGIEEKFEKCNDKLASVSVGPCSYQFQADKIERMTGLCMGNVGQPIVCGL